MPLCVFFATAATAVANANAMPGKSNSLGFKGTPVRLAQAVGIGKIARADRRSLADFLPRLPVMIARCEGVRVGLRRAQAYSVVAALALGLTAGPGVAQESDLDAVLKESIK